MKQDDITPGMAESSQIKFAAVDKGTLLRVFGISSGLGEWL
jgi:hypothetical protein